MVSEPGNPQALNRYSYCLGNPLRYVDPTGYFTEEEIMGFLGVDTWEEVLAFFEEGGSLAGRWGWLEVLRLAELGDEVSFWRGHPTSGELVFRGTFAESSLGTTLIEGIFYGGTSGWEGFETKLGLQDAAKLTSDNYLVEHRVGPGAVFALIKSDTINYHTKFDASKFDWVGAAFDISGIVADCVSGIGGRGANAAEIAAKAHKIGDALDVASLIRTGIVSRPEGISDDEWTDLSLDAAGLVIPIIPDVFSLIFNIRQATYRTP
jgi:hypothetical protein